MEAVIPRRRVAGFYGSSILILRGTGILLPLAAAHFTFPPVALKGSVSSHPPVLTFSCFVFGWFVCAGSSSLQGLFSSCGQQALLSRCCVWASCGGFRCCGTWALGCTGIVFAALGL